MSEMGLLVIYTTPRSLINARITTPTAAVTSDIIFKPSERIRSPFCRHFRLVCKPLCLTKIRPLTQLQQHERQKTLRTRLETRMRYSTDSKEVTLN